MKFCNFHGGQIKIPRIMILSPVELNCPVDRINLIGSHRDTVMRLSVERREKEGATIILYGFMTILRCNMIAPDLFSVNSLI